MPTEATSPVAPPINTVTPPRRPPTPAGSPSWPILITLDNQQRHTRTKCAATHLERCETAGLFDRKRRRSVGGSRSGGASINITHWGGAGVGLAAWLLPCLTSEGQIAHVDVWNDYTQ